MAEVRTSHRSAPSHVAQTSTSPFDMRSWQGLTSVLQMGRDAGLNAGEYAQFRDLVLSYAQSGGDAGIKTKIDTAIAGFTKKETKAPVQEEKDRGEEKRKGASPAAQKQNVEPRVVTISSDRMRGGRPAPTFAGTGATSAHLPEATEIKAEPIPKLVPLMPVPRESKEDSKKEPKVTTPQSSLPTPREELPTQELTDAPVTPTSNPLMITTEPIAQENSKDARAEKIWAEEEEKGTKDAPLPEVALPISPIPEVATVIPPQAPPSAQSIEQFKARITEIKRTVHSTIGNPVTLMDAGNQVGRAYMNALLVALKSTGGGSPVPVEEAMRKLEDSFEALQKLGKPDRAETPVPRAASEPRVEKEVVPIPEQISKAVPVEPRVEVQSPPKVQVPIPPPPPILKKESAIVPPVEIKSAPKRAEEIPVASPRVRTESNPPLNLPIDEKETIEIPVKKSAPIQPPVTSEKLDVPPRKISETPNSTPIPVMPVKVAEEISSMPTVTPLSTTRPPTSSVEPKIPVPDPLVSSPHYSTVTELSTIPVHHTTLEVELDTDEITVALYQLLHEWSIFRSSGMFGTGPGGADHPLYKKISNLPMLTVSNGGWGDAKPDERQSIRDYINAWRHEQSISYNPMESFEHYLRRVIQRVQRRQARN